ncbi:MAG: SPASM domain-containing protein [Candidatus Diapherotrites archaeon]|nr:SPASM domain-containing protein [Candidatus Diapherotrites archaeon]
MLATATVVTHAVMPDGSIGICHYAATVGIWCMGHVNDKGIEKKLLTNDIIREWAERSPINMSECEDCPGLVMCGGGCPYQAYEKKGSIWALDENFCIHCKESINWLMHDLYREVNK